MKKYILYTERYVTDKTVYELPDDFDVENFIKDGNNPFDLDIIEGVTVHNTEYEVSDYNSDWYRFEDEEGNVIDEY